MDPLDCVPLLVAPLLCAIVATVILSLITFMVFVWVIRFFGGQDKFESLATKKNG